MNARIKDITERLARTDVEDTDTMIVELAKVTIAVRALTVDDMREDCPPGVKSAHLRVGVDLFQAAADATAKAILQRRPARKWRRGDFMGRGNWSENDEGGDGVSPPRRKGGAEIRSRTWT